MKMRKAQRFAAAVLLAGSATACDSMLGVENLNQPDIEAVFGTPAAVEQTIGAGYQSVHNALATNNLMPQMLTISLEMYSSLNNFNLGVRVTIPRSPVMNATGAPSIFGDFSALSRNGRLAVNALNALDALIEADATPADGVLGSPGDDLRTRAFAFFVIGTSQGWLAMVYDSVGHVRNGMASDEVPPLVGADQMMVSALEMLDSAEAIASSSQAAGGFPLPSAWFSNADDQLSQDGFISVVRSYRARFRAGVARTPTERAAVDWAAVRADAEGGIESDFMVQSGGSTGWNIGFVGSQMFQDGRAWGQLTLMYFGMSDTTGAYTAWIGQDLMDRQPFLVRSPDRRWPRGETRTAQIDNSWGEDGNGLGFPANHLAKPYIAAQQQDEIADGWGWSYYQFNRTRYIREATNTATNQGPWMEMLKAENDLLLAEAYLELGMEPEAIAIINTYRTANDLPAIPATAAETDPVPGADYVTDANGVITSVTPNPAKSNCVPRVPTGSGTTECGDVREALKYEKRMETAYSSYARWWIDGRGWGDLVQNTHYEYPVPFQEMDARQLPPYPTGGGVKSSAALGTYGF
jgi:hypothetical protein